MRLMKARETVFGRGQEDAHPRQPVVVCVGSRTTNQPGLWTSEPAKLMGAPGLRLFAKVDKRPVIVHTPILEDALQYKRDFRDSETSGHPIQDDLNIKVLLRMQSKTAERIIASSGKQDERGGSSPSARNRVKEEMRIVRDKRSLFLTLAIE